MYGPCAVGPVYGPCAVGAVFGLCAVGTALGACAVGSEFGCIAVGPVDGCCAVGAEPGCFVAGVGVLAAVAVGEAESVGLTGGVGDVSTLLLLVGAVLLQAEKRATNRAIETAAGRRIVQLSQEQFKSESC